MRGGEEGGGALVYKRILTLQYYCYLSLEITTKITHWSPDYTSEFRQLFTSGKNRPQIDQNMRMEFSFN